MCPNPSRVARRVVEAAPTDRRSRLAWRILNRGLLGGVQRAVPLAQGILERSEIDAHHPGRREAAQDLLRSARGSVVVSDVLRKLGRDAQTDVLVNLALREPVFRHSPISSLVCLPFNVTRSSITTPGCTSYRTRYCWTRSCHV